MIPMNLKDAVTALIQDQANNKASIDNTLKAICLLTMEEFQKLSVIEQKAVEKFYKTATESALSTHPDLVKPFLAFKKALFPEIATKPSIPASKLSIAKELDQNITSAAKFSIVKALNKELVNVCDFLSPKDLDKIATSCKGLQKLSIEEIIRRLNRGESALSLGFDQRSLLSFLKRHGSLIRSLSLDAMQKLSIEEIYSFIHLCPRLRALSLQDLKIKKKELLPFLQEHGPIVYKLSFGAMQYLSANEAHNLIQLCPHLTALSLQGHEIKKRELLPFLQEHGSIVYKLSLDTMQNSNLDEISKLIKLCPSLTALSLQDPREKKEGLLSFLQQYGAIVHKLSLNNMQNSSLDEINKFIILCPNLTDLSMQACALHSDMAEQIAKAVCKTKITHLDLSRNKIGSISPEIC
jgi:hypothetical protein